MEMRQINVSDEYLDSVCEWLLSWAEKEDSFALPQFIQEKGIGYPFLKFFSHRSPKVHNTMEVVKAMLHTRMLKKIMVEHNMSNHQAKVLLRYLKIYDSHAYDMETQERMAVAEAEKKAEAFYAAENYANLPLEPQYEKIYQKNEQKKKDSRLH